MKFQSQSRFLTTVCLLIAVNITFADVRLPALIADYMVLQQGMDAHLWGWAEPGEKIRVKGSWQTAERSTVADKEGKWKVALDTPQAGGPYKIEIKTDENAITVDNVMVGEVWVCSGQSNMQMSLMENGNWHKGVCNYQSEIAAADYPDIRLFTVKPKISTIPLDNCEGAWSQCSPETVAGFSATAYFFAREVYHKTKTPIGLIHTSWGGTPAESWTSRPTLESLKTYKQQLEKVPVSVIDTAAIDTAAYQKNMTEWETKRYSMEKDNQGFGKGYANLEFHADDWKTMSLPTAWESLGDDMNINGVVWFRKEINLPPSWAGKDLALSLGPIEDCDVTYFNGQKVGSISYETENYWQVERRYKVRGSLVREGKNIIAVRVFDDRGEGGLNGKKEQLNVGLVGTEDSISLAGDWKYKVESILDTEPVQPVQPINQDSPTVLYNAMIHPLIPYRIRGAIWYQGESNHTMGHAYRTLFPAMIQNWRDAWGQGNFPFYYVQIAPFKYIEPMSAPFLREAQLMTLSLPNTGMVVTTDITDDVGDVHPRNKQDVGKRLALWALAKTYNEKQIVYSGPLYRSMRIKGDTIRIQFDHTGSGLVVRGNELTHFVIAGKDEHFRRAKAVIEGDTVVVSSDKVKKPAAVRFGWSNTAVPNLFNKEGLPASPFRTDDWYNVTFEE